MLMKAIKNRNICSTLQQRRARAKLITMYKIINDQIDITKDFFIP